MYGCREFPSSDDLNLYIMNVLPPSPEHLYRENISPLYFRFTFSAEYIIIGDVIRSPASAMM